MEYKFDELYERLKEKSHTLNWGMISFMDRVKLNRLLTQLYIHRFKTSSYLAPITGSIANGAEWRFALNDFTLALPRLDFMRKLSNDSKARLNMPVVAGTQLGLKLSGGTWEIREIRETSVLQGPELSLDLLLANVPGEVGKEGRVRFDLKQSADFSLTVSDDPGEQRLVGEFFKQKFEKLPDEQRVFELGQIEAGVNPLLRAKSFALRTQARGRSETDEEGAVLTLIRYEGDGEGDLPGNDFSYLIPSDKHYDATVLFEPKRIMLAQLLESLQKIASDVEFEITRDEEGRPTGAVAKSGIFTVPQFELEHEFQTEPDRTGRVWDMVLKLRIYEITLDMVKVLGVSIQENTVVVDWRVAGVMGIEPLDLDDKTHYIKKVLNDLKFDTSEFYQYSEDTFEYEVKSVYELKDAEGGLLQHTLFEMKEIKAPAPPVGEIKLPEMPPIETDPVRWFLYLMILSIPIVLYMVGMVTAVVLSVIRAVGQTEFPSIESTIRDALEQNFKFSDSVKQLVQDTIKLNFGNAIIGQDQYAPRDVSFFGNVNPAVTAFAIEPMLYSMAAGSAPKQFSTVPTNSNLEWSIEPVLDTVLSTKIGSIDKTTGLYTPPIASELDDAFVQLRVKAQDKASTFSSSALVTVMKAAVQVNPLAYVTQAKGTVNLQAGYLGDASKLTWQLKSPGLGKVVGNGAKAVYSAPEHMPPSDPDYPDELAAFAVDEVQLSAPGGGPAKTALLITESAIKQPMMIERVVDPVAGTVQLTAVINGKPQPAEKIDWKVRYGTGSVDPKTGVYTHDKSSNDKFALITASYDTGLIGIFEGYVLQTLPPEKLEDAVLGVGAFEAQKVRQGDQA